MIKRAYIEITNACNLSCSFCKKNTRQIHYMSPEFFSHILSQVQEYTDYIYLHVQGEPLLHPDLEKILDICDHAEVYVQLVTNGTLIENNMNIMHHSCLRKISFSLQSTEAQHSENIVSYLDQVLKFCEAASILGHPICELRMWRAEVENADAYNYCMSMINRRYTLHPTDRKNSFKLMDQVYLDFGTTWKWPDEHDPITSTTGYCHGAVDQIAILSNGTVVPCCLDANGNVAFGNLRITSLKEILNSGRYTQMVKGLKQRQLREPFCQKCTFRTRFDKH